VENGGEPEDEWRKEVDEEEDCPLESDKRDDPSVYLRC
jgi:hypothetical protein